MSFGTFEKTVQIVDEVPVTLQSSSIRSTIARINRIRVGLSRGDIVTFLFPVATFGVLAALSGSLLTTNASPNILSVFLRLPLSVIFIYLNLVVFELGNQRLPEAVLEDMVNKPWRPIPSGEISPDCARRLLWFLTPFTWAVTWYLGAGQETGILLMLNWIYNDLGASDETYIFRNAITASAFFFYNLGALKIHCSPAHAPNTAAYVWLALFSTMIVTSMHISDIYDRVGDAAKGRKTVPVVFGHVAARWSLVPVIAFWSVACPAFLGVGVYGYVVPVALAAAIVARLLLLQDSIKADKRTYQLWAMWMVFAIAPLPVVASPPAWPQLF